MVVQANAAARRSFEAPAPPVPLARVLRDPGVLAAVNGALAGTSASSVSFSPSHDRAKQFSSRIEPVDLGDGGQGALIALREQTEQVMIERMRSDFVANASHEIRTPLASIQGFIETLRGPARHDPKARETFLEIMAEEAGADGAPGRRSALAVADRARRPPAAARAVRSGRGRELRARPDAPDRRAERGGAGRRRPGRPAAGDRAMPTSCISCSST